MYCNVRFGCRLPHVFALLPPAKSRKLVFIWYLIIFGYWISAMPQMEHTVDEIADYAC